MQRAWSRAPDQIGYLVHDLESSRQRWQQQFGVGPWMVFRNVRLSGECRGQAVEVGMDVAMGYQGDVQIELIRPLPANPSPYYDTNGRLLSGMHHLAWVVDDFDRALAQLTANGLQSAFYGQNPSTRVAYLENPQDPGMLYEIIYGAQMREMFAQGIAAARTWNGNDPVTVINLASPQP